MSERPRCRKHEPEAVDGFWGRRVRCKACGMEGLLSNGQRRLGRLRRIIWLRGKVWPSPTTTPDSLRDVMGSEDEGNTAFGFQPCGEASPDGEVFGPRPQHFDGKGES